ncbi:MAG: distal tail protein Dit [Bacillota bacterium]
MSMTTLRPIGDGAYDSWDPFPAAPATKYDKVSEVVADDDATYIYTSAAMHQTFTKDAIVGTPYSVTLKARARNSSGSSQILLALQHSAGAPALEYSDLKALTGSYAEYSYTWYANPFTGGLWAEADFNNMQFGLEHHTVGPTARITQIWMEVEIIDAAISPTDAGVGADALAIEFDLSTLVDTGAGSDSASITATLATLADGGTNQQEAAGMGAVDDPRYEGPSIAATLAATDSGAGADVIASLIASIMAVDAGVGTDAASIAATLATLLDDGTGADALILVANIFPPDAGSGEDVILSVSGSIVVSETGAGADSVAWVAKAYFYITEEGILNPLGVVVLNDSRYDLLPATRENVETVPGRHGEIDFGSEFQPRLLELRVALGEDYTRSQWDQVKRTLARYLNPILGAKNLIFADDVEKMYQVKFAGKIDFSQLNNWLEFTIPFKASDPFIIGSYLQSQSGSGTLTNEGTFETPLTIEIAGPVTNPSVVVGSDTLSYIGEVVGGSTLTIDTETKTVKLNSSNALATYTGGFPVLQAGDTAVTAASGGTTTWNWRSRWV